MDAQLEAAFRATRYRVLAPGRDFVIRVGVHSPDLQQLMLAAAASHAALLTAFNPRAHPHDRQWNEVRQQLLRDEIAACGHGAISCRNEDPAGHWPTEESLLALGMTLSTAGETADRYGQLAFLWIGANAVPQLIETAAASS
jgi:hypothetical protein